LIKEFFEMSAQEAIKEMKLLTDDDKNQLATAIASQKGLVESDCDFKFTAY